MNKLPHTLLLFLFAWGIFFGSFKCNAQPLKADHLFDSLYELLRSEYPALRNNKISADSVIVEKSKKNIKFYAPKYWEGIPYREDNARWIKDSIRSVLPQNLSNYKIEIFTNGYEINDLIPNCFRVEEKLDKDRMEKHRLYEHPIVSNLSKPYQPSKGLFNNHIALWASHGWYFEKKSQEWIWQRPRLFSVSEDTYTLGYVIPYLLPMLENAGAYVMMPRERDTQTNEVIVDNDDRDFLYEECHGKKHRWKRGDSTGFGNPKEIYIENENPFCYGSYRQIECDKDGMAYANWTPEIPEEGDYAVYIAYQSLPQSTTDANYIVYHTGGSTQFIVNQQMGGGTWIYLGTFHFLKGMNPTVGRVELSNKGQNGTIVTADAVRFGGGYSNIGRTDKEGKVTIGNKPRYLEAARYWLQWAGYPDTVYNKNEFNDDYKDDYMSRGYWVNNLIGGSNKSSETEGKHIPIEMAMGFHTDAGQLFNDSIIGTLAIYRTLSYDRTEYANGQRRITSRDLTDIVQTQVVEDIRQTYRPDWTRRRMVDASYFEAREPEVPTFLLELLSHQNFTDMRYGLDPHFKFTVCRAIYKGILKYLAYQQYREYVVQPLPVQNFSIEFFNKENNVVHLSWSEQGDSLEPTANANHYILYTSIDHSGWDNGTITNTPSIQISLEPNRLYRFKVTAVNDGGESFPSEILAAGHCPNSEKKALIINGFHRISAPEWFDSPNHSGFLDNVDQGVPDKYDLSYTGQQYAFNKRNKFKSNDLPGHGASHAIFENDKIAGNTFDFPAIHGESILKAGYSFVSCSDEVITDAKGRLKGYDFIDLIYGEEKSTKVGDNIRYQLFPDPLRNALSRYLFRQNGRLFVSGAYIASDIFERDSCDNEAVLFAERVLKYQLAESHSPVRPILSNYFSPFKQFKHQYFHYCNILNGKQYAVEAPDAIDTSNGSKIIFSFEGSNLPAAVGYQGRYRTMISSIPFESIESQEERDTLMKEIVKFFE